MNNIQAQMLSRIVFLISDMFIEIKYIYYFNYNRHHHFLIFFIVRMESLDEQKNKRIENLTHSFTDIMYFCFSIILSEIDII